MTYQSFSLFINWKNFCLTLDYEIYYLILNDVCVSKEKHMFCCFR